MTPGSPSAPKVSSMAFIRCRAPVACRPFLEPSQSSSDAPRARRSPDAAAWQSECDRMKATASRLELWIGVQSGTPVAFRQAINRAPNPNRGGVPIGADRGPPHNHISQSIIDGCLAQNGVPIWTPNYNVMLRRSPDGAFVLVVHDDGDGGVIVEGNGLGGMRERLARIGGLMAVDSGRSGVAVTVTIPDAWGGDE
jgi:hypothetical protein